MSERRYNAFAPQSFMQMQNLPTSNATNLPSSCDEGLADEADEPPDYFRYLIFGSACESGYSKHTIRHSPPSESLLTRALVNSPGPTLIGRGPYGAPLKRGISTASVWSNASGASTADLTSDCGLTGSSRANTPSPPPPMFFGGLTEMLHSNKGLMPESRSKRLAVASDTEAAEGPGRKRCITFACQDQPMPRKLSSDGTMSATGEPEKAKIEEPVAPKRACLLRFTCEDTTSKRPRTPPPTSAPRRRDSESSATNPIIETTPKGNHTAPASISNRKPTMFQHKFYEFASSVEDMADSWTNQPIDKSRLLKVDDLLKKELSIRKMGQEAEDEALQEEEEENELENGVLGGDDDEDDDEDAEDGFNDDEDEDEEGSGNETDDEEGFASDSDDDDDDMFFVYGPQPLRPLCCRTSSESSLESFGRQRAINRRAPRPQTPPLPDSTDFVCGTLDEDKPLEDAYVSCMKERKRLKHVPTPQDIDPSFPTSDNDDDADDRMKSSGSEGGFIFGKVKLSGSSVEGNLYRGRRRNDTVTKKSHPHSRSPHGRTHHSPAPVRRTINAHSPIPARRITRAVSPPPPDRNKNRTRITFEAPRSNIVRTKSLPRNSGFMPCKTSRNTSTATSPVRNTVRPVFIRRGAVDIVKGLEKRRQRRQARLNRTKAESWRAGEGVEKMRELGLEICSKGKGRTNAGQAQWVLSA